MRTFSKGSRKCKDEWSRHPANSCPQYSFLSPFELTMAFVIILWEQTLYLSGQPKELAYVAKEHRKAYRGCSNDEALSSITFALMVEAPLSNTSVTLGFISDSNVYTAFFFSLDTDLSGVWT